MSTDREEAEKISKAILTGGSYETKVIAMFAESLAAKVDRMTSDPSATLLTGSEVSRWIRECARILLTGAHGLTPGSGENPTPPQN